MKYELYLYFYVNFTFSSWVTYKDNYVRKTTKDLFSVDRLTGGKGGSTRLDGINWIAVRAMLSA